VKSNFCSEFRTDSPRSGRGQAAGTPSETSCCLHKGLALMRFDESIKPKAFYALDCGVGAVDAAKSEAKTPPPFHTLQRRPNSRASKGVSVIHQYRVEIALATAIASVSCLDLAEQIGPGNRSPFGTSRHRIAMHFGQSGR
jgi:hypothetical protein